MAGMVLVTCYAGISFIALGARLWRRATPLEQQQILVALWTTTNSLPDTPLLDVVRRVASHLQRSMGVSAFLLMNVISSMFLLRAALVCRLLLGPLSATEAGRMAERLLKLFMVNVVSLGALVTPNTSQLIAWTFWCDYVIPMRQPPRHLC